MWDDYEIDGDAVYVMCKGNIIDTLDLNAIIEEYLEEHYGEDQGVIAG